MKELTSLFVAAGCTDVETYIQSGNVIFKVSAARAKSLLARIENELTAYLGNAVPLVIRTALEMRSIVQKNPFLAAGADPDVLHVAFLADAPSALQIASLDTKRSKPDQFKVSGREIYLQFPNGTAKSKLTNAYFDRMLETTSTIRNWRTVLSLLERATR